jgi:hypothetical protein
LFRSQQGGISGNSKVGCDAIIVAGKRKDHLTFEKDDFFSLCYCASTREGAGAIIRSKALQSTIRVFRSSAYKNQFKALAGLEGKKRQMYRYDGLYEIVSIQYQETENHKKVNVQDAAKHLQQTKLPTDRIYIFHFQRIQPSASNQQNSNNYSNHEILFYCVHMLTMDPSVLIIP